MKRIVIIEGNVSSLSCHHDEYSTSITRGGSEIVLDITPEAADQIGASFREPMRVVVEIGEADVVVGSLASATREELHHALAHARHVADEYRRENAALARSNEGLSADLDEMMTRNGDLLCKIAAGPVAFDPEKHITKVTVARWLEEDARRGDRSSEAHAQSGNSDAALEAKASASDTRAIIARINATKETP